jgi:hypothetical protein
MQRHEVHVLMPDGTEFIYDFRVDSTTGLALIPSRLLYWADWIYDITAKAILKNKTAAKFNFWIAAEHVDTDWMQAHKYLAVITFPVKLNVAKSPLNLQNLVP